MPADPRDYIYDVETYPNIFTLAAKHHATGMRYLFEISHRRNDRPALMVYLKYLHDHGCRMVGYNNAGFDYTVLDFILKYPDMLAPQIYDRVQQLIGSDDRFGHVIWDPYIPQIDLFKIHHFDNKAKQTSLKVIEINMRSKNIIDLPFPVGMFLTDEQMDVLIEYNHHDVDETEKFYVFAADSIRFREELTAKYNRNFMNHNDTKIGKDYFIMELEKAAPGSCYEPGTRNPRQTIRPHIDLSQVVFPWIKFKRPEFQAVCDWFKSQTITETKGVFLEIPEERLGGLAKYCNLKRHREIYKPGMTVPAGTTFEMAKNGKTQYAVWNKVENLHTVVNGFRFDFGTGGIHGSVDSCTVMASDTHDLIDIDVSSFYPNLGIVNRIYPQHLGVMFCDIYLDVYNQRKNYAKGTSENGMLKLALNGVYGDSNNPYSPFYDPAYTMSITINGQLLLCLLADYLMDIPGLQMIQVNTDGVTVLCPKNYRHVLDSVTDWWQKHTLLELEFVDYRAMWIRDVNNYIAQSADGKKIKRKGAYAHVFTPPKLNKGNGDLDWHQDHSALVVPKAAEAALVRGEDIAAFIFNHPDPFDFMLRAKVPRNCRLMIDDRQVQNVTRHFVSRHGGAMMKVMPPLPKAPDKQRWIGICAGRRVLECNDADHFDRSLLDFDYYIKEAEKLVNPLRGR